MRTLILGCGFSGIRIARELAAYGPVLGTRRGADGLAELARHGIGGFILGGEGEDVGTAGAEAGAGGTGEGGELPGAARAIGRGEVRDAHAGGEAAGEREVDGASPATLEHALARTTHLISSVAPGRELPLDDPMLEAIAPRLAAGLMPNLVWIGYLSTIGVYGDHGGAWVDEGTPCTSRQARSMARLEAERAWRALGAAAGLPLAVLRLSGIYGPGRNAVRDALAGRARVLVGHGQVFNRVHVDDLARAAALAARSRADGLFNISDALPAVPETVVRHAHALVGLEPPAAVPFEEAELSPMARSFYAERKRVRNARSREVLGLQYRYPNYRAGLASLLAYERDASDGSGESAPAATRP